MSRREAIIAKVRSVPAIPTSASKVLQLLHDPDFELEDVIFLIEHDHVATANILRLANSASFGSGRSVASVRDAVVRLGAQRTGQLMMAAAVGPVAVRPLQGYDLPPGDLWRHSVAVAMACDLLAQSCRLKAPNYTFTAGLLHDLGKVVLDVFIQAESEPIRGLAFVENVTFEMAERQILGADHPEIGAILLESWGVPAELVAAVRWHHNPDAAPDTLLAADLVHTADYLAMQAGLGAGVDAPTYKLSESVLARLRIAQPALDEIATMLQDRVEAIEEVFSLTKG